MLQRFSLLLAALVIAVPLWAASAIEEVIFDDQTQLDRYKGLIAELRCPMCLNANLAGSDAPIAADLRAEIQQQILSGKSDKEILAFLVDRYGEFILYEPRLHLSTSLLWFGPPLLLIAGFFILRRMLSSKQQLAEAQVALTEEEQQRLHSMLDDNSAETDRG